MTRTGAERKRRTKGDMLSRWMRMIAAATMACSAAGAANAAVGDVLQCNVVDFHANARDLTPSAAFDAANRNGTWEIEELADRLVVTLRNDGADPLVTEYRTAGRTSTQIFAVAEWVTAAWTLALATVPRTGEDRLHATIVRQASSYVTIWYLECSVVDKR